MSNYPRHRRGCFTERILILTQRLPPTVLIRENIIDIINNAFSVDLFYIHKRAAVRLFFHENEILKPFSVTANVYAEIKRPMNI